MNSTTIFEARSLSRLAALAINPVEANFRRQLDRDPYLMVATPNANGFWRYKPRFKIRNRAIRLASGMSFEAVAQSWMAEHQSTVRAGTSAHAAARLKNDVLPLLGKRPIAAIDAPEILAVLKKVDERGARNTAHRVRGLINQIFSYAVRQGLCKGNPARDLAGAIPTAVPRHFASIVEPDKVGKLLRSFDGFSGTYPVACALKLAPMLFVRPGELRKAEWSQVDLDKAQWRYTVSKTNTDHLVPLATQAVAILRDLHALTGKGRYLFPGARNAERPMSHATINAALRRLGYETRTEITGHGFRAMARTILHEELEQKPEVIEHQLAHTVPDTLGRAYNRTRFLKERRAMMQLWADYLDRLKKNGLKSHLQAVSIYIYCIAATTLRLHTQLFYGSNAAANTSG